MDMQPHWRSLLPEISTSRSGKISKPTANIKWTNPHGIQNSKKRGGIRDQSRRCGPVSNVQTDVPLRVTLHKLSFPQPPNPIKIDNSAAEGIVTAMVRQKKSQGNGYVILLDEVQVKEKNFFVYWKP